LHRPKAARAGAGYQVGDALCLSLRLYERAALAEYPVERGADGGQFVVGQRQGSGAAEATGAHGRPDHRAGFRHDQDRLLQPGRETERCGGRVAARLRDAGGSPGPRERIEALLRAALPTDEESRIFHHVYTSYAVLSMRGAACSCGAERSRTGPPPRRPRQPGGPRAPVRHGAMAERALTGC